MLEMDGKLSQCPYLSNHCSMQNPTLNTSVSLLDLGDNIEFFFKCNVGLEPDTRPYKEAIL